MTEKYKRYLRSPEWQIKRQQRLEIDGFKCVMCGRPASRCRSGLQIHHVSYARLGHEDVYRDLVSLCAPCHRKIHNFYDRVREEPKE